MISTTLPAVACCGTRAGKNLGFTEKYLSFSFFRFLNYIFCKALIAVAHLRCRRYVSNKTAALTTHTSIKLLLLLLLMMMMMMMIIIIIICMYV